MEISTILFNHFETLDAFGPIEILGRLKEQFKIKIYSLDGGIVYSNQSIPVLTDNILEIPNNDFILLIPGGLGARNEINNQKLINIIQKKGMIANYILSVCTGAALLAKTNLLDQKRATTNKRRFIWVKSINKNVMWIKKARWVVDGNIYTSSGISAGIDMTIAFIRDLLGEKIAMRQCQEIEYIWNKNPKNDPFADLTY
ncbi:MAG: DJ-1/PfpI family protein [Candidatus Lokiarchaeota archaeon]|nr:DJ-1/PfpI family protein [Candidatus Lokiarchaeota archaeon]